MGYLGYSSRERSYISLKLITTFEDLQTKQYIQGTSFLLAVTILHEFIHWGRVYNICQVMHLVINGESLIMALIGK